MMPMSYDTNISYDDAASFNFNPTFVEIISTGFSTFTIQLKDLGGGLVTTVPQLITSQYQVMLSGLTGFTQTLNYLNPDGTSELYQFVINGNAYWYNPATTTWEIATGVAQANTAAVINTNAATLFTDIAIFETTYLGLNTILQTTDATVSPSLISNTLSYDWTNGNPAAISNCLVYAYLSDLVGGLPINSLTKPISLIVSSEAAFLHGSKFIMPFSKEVFFNLDGYVEISLIETETPGIPLSFVFKYHDGFSVVNTRLFNAIVPNEATRGLNSLTTVVPYNFG
jgi:hypothetical protein